MTQAKTEQYVPALINRIFDESEVIEELLAPALRVPDIVRRIAQARDNLVQRFGPLLSVTPSPRDATLRFRGATVPARISFDSEGRVGGLYFETPRHRPLSGEACLSSLASKPGNKAIYIRRNGSDWLSYNADLPLAVGSSFKILVYEEIVRSVQEGHFGWTDVVELSPESASFGGIFDRWPVGTPFTIESLCTAMIAARAIIPLSEHMPHVGPETRKVRSAATICGACSANGIIAAASDNTATDMLIELVGRPALEKSSPRNRPFLKTREMFLLKFGLGRELAPEYVVGSNRSKQRILNRIKDWPVHSQPTGFDPAPRIEWFYSTRELADVIDRVQSGRAFLASGGPFDEEYGQL